MLTRGRNGSGLGRVDTRLAVVTLNGPGKARSHDVNCFTHNDLRGRTVYGPKDLVRPIIILLRQSENAISGCLGRFDPPHLEWDLVK